MKGTSTVCKGPQQFHKAGWWWYVPEVSVVVFIVHRMDELAASDSALRLKERLLEQERDLLGTQNEWLRAELEAKAEQLIELNKERSGTVGELEGRVARQGEEVRNVCPGQPLRTCQCRGFQLPSPCHVLNTSSRCSYLL